MLTGWNKERFYNIVPGKKAGIGYIIKSLASSLNIAQNVAKSFVLRSSLNLNHTF